MLLTVVWQLTKPSVMLLGLFRDKQEPGNG